MICPQCNAENMKGAEICDECGASLDYLSQPQPASRTEWRIVRDKVKVLDPAPPITVAPETRVRDVIEMLVGRSIGCVLVADGDKLLGIFSERDALTRLGTDGADLGELPIGQFMTPNPETLQIDDTIAFALHKMDLGHYRHLPVLREGRVCGVISIRDIIGYITEDLVPTE